MKRLACDIPQGRQETGEEDIHCDASQVTSQTQWAQINHLTSFSAPTCRLQTTSAEVNPDSKVSLQDAQPEWETHSAQGECSDRGCVERLLDERLTSAWCITL